MGMALRHPHQLPRSCRAGQCLREGRVKLWEELDAESFGDYLPRPGNDLVGRWPVGKHLYSAGADLGHRRQVREMREV